MRKHAEKNIGKIAISREDKRRIIYILIISLFVILIASLYLFYSFKVRFELSDELNVIINPKYSSFNKTNNETLMLNVSITNDNFRNCKAKCKFSLVDLSDNSIMASHSDNLSHDETIVNEYRISTPEYGSGQMLLNFKAECINIQSLICRTPGEKRRETSLIVINYDLSGEEKRVAENLRNEIDNYLLLYNDLKTNFSTTLSANSIFPDSSLEKQIFIEKFNELSIEIKKHERLQEKMFQEWEENKFENLDKDFNSTLLEDLDRINSEIIRIRENQSDIRSVWESYIKAILRSENYFVPIRNAVGFYEGNLNQQNLQRISDLNENVIFYNKQYSDLVDETTFSIRLSNKDILDAEKGIISSIDEWKSIREKGLILSNYTEIATNQLDQWTSRPKKGDLCRKSEFGKNAFRSLNNNASDFIFDKLNISSTDPDFQKFQSKKSMLFEENLLRNMSINNFTFTIDSYFKDIINRLVKRASKINISLSNYSKQKNLSQEDKMKIIKLNTSYFSEFSKEYCGDWEIKDISTDPITEFVNLDFHNFMALNLTFTGKNDVNESIKILPELMAICCVKDECNECNNGFPKNSIPLIFIHGHSLSTGYDPSYSMKVFSDMQELLSDEGYINGGELDISLNGLEFNEGELGRSEVPVSFRASYYYITHYNLGNYEVTTQKSERIENYALRLAEIISLVKDLTGAEKVDIVAHSMGGLVARKYINIFDGGSIRKLIMINTPNHGIDEDIQKYCSVLGAENECDDMAMGSVFLNKLNSQKLPNKVELYAIRSTGCVMANGEEGDGIVTNESAYLDGADNYLIRGKCTDSLGTSLHSEVLDPSLYPETYRLITEILSN